jgi:hypothetical protein
MPATTGAARFSEAPTSEPRASTGEGGSTSAPVERATSSIEEWVQRKALLSLVYVGLTGAALVLILAGLNAATGASGIARGYLGARAARGAGDVIPF